MKGGEMVIIIIGLILSLIGTLLLLLEVYAEVILNNWAQQIGDIAPS